MRVDFFLIGFIAALAILLLVADRMYRINPYLAMEGFRVAGQPQRCGADLEPCPHPKRCMNGYCYGSDTPQMYDRNPLPVVP
jgi:hypothetical protein